MIYVVTVCGGRGPNTWDSEFTVEAENEQEAKAKAQEMLDKDEWAHDCCIAAVEPKD